MALVLSALFALERVHRRPTLKSVPFDTHPVCGNGIARQYWPQPSPRYRRAFIAGYA